MKKINWLKPVILLASVIVLGICIYSFYLGVTSRPDYAFNYQPYYILAMGISCALGLWMLMLIVEAVINYISNTRFENIMKSKMK